jgi:hypothetical protein
VKPSAILGRVFVAIFVVVGAGGCSDIFALGGNGADMSAGGVLSMPDLFFIPGPVLTDGGFGGRDGGALLPSSCALLPCSPGSDEGDVTVSSGSLTGCHAYDHLIIGDTVRFDTFTACALTVDIGGTLDGNAGGAPERNGPGSPGLCPAGAGHGGLGADPNSCGAGMIYGDATHPRETGSGGGGFGGGRGGGQLELAAGTVTIAGLVRADGENAAGASCGGGSGGSILIAADTIVGAGSIEARGGNGFGFRGGGGGGGRVSVLKTSGVAIPVDVGGGRSTDGPDGNAGTIVQP